MSVSVELPELGESVVEGTVSKWLVKEGDRVERDQPLVEVTTDKVDAEIPSPAEGVVEKILVAEGETVDVGTELVRIDEGATGGARPEASREEPEAAQEEAGARPEAAQEAGSRAEAASGSEGSGAEDEPRSTPVARRMAEESQVDLREVSGSGVSGRVTKSDVAAHARAARGGAPSRPERRAQEPRREPAPGPAQEPRREPAPGPAQEPRREPAPRPAASRPAPSGSAGGQALVSDAARQRFGHYALQEGDRVTPMSPLRKLVAEHMVYSKHVSPHVGTVAEVDLGGVAEVRSRHKSEFQRAHGFSLTYLPFVVHATVRALREFPALNASVIEDAIVEKVAIHIGIAVETEKGLIVPVVRHADRLSLAGLAEAVEDLSSRARSKRLSADELQGGTFTVTNPGRQGNLYGFAIINQPQVGILRMGEIVKRPVVRPVDGQDAILIRPMMHLALSYDHRAVDGAPANGFLYRVRELLEEAEFDL